MSGWSYEGRWALVTGASSGLANTIRAGVEWAKRQPFVNPEKIGITGNSYGGMLTMYAISFAPGEPITSSPVAPTTVIVAFSRAVNKNAAQKAIEIKTSPAVDGKFYWKDDKTVHWRPAKYWAAGTTDIPSSSASWASTSRLPGAP